ncbi:ImmA/IrrE family metallo-endopeptidase [Pseudofrankia sp. BMG5.36]|uniref:ImmA/IrrE family metallo-endopeptidase n=1 Tax=Pseudofrankia sp. BMG5.36 TaxID=1834512 RepID=UPI0008D912BE|nr:ImmA/IrrE family metallo-endopeptidase [Pseudofrankia sp. BMG5.36]OHV61389.1 hypothetical protein BCD48_39675 [Pseudofrankia sp. BMG5.36]
MEDSRKDILEQVRRLMPARTLDLLARPLSRVEARVVAERQAYALLRGLGITKPSVDIELVAELPEIEVVVVPGLASSGYSQWNPRKRQWLVQINADDSLWRCRSSLAHEMKHILDDPFREALYPGWRRDDAAGSAEAEALCDYFAGCVLVPRPWLEQAWRAGMRARTALASVFDVSEALIGVRLRQVGLERVRPASRKWRGDSRTAYRRSGVAIRRAGVGLRQAATSPVGALCPGGAL